MASTWATPTERLGVSILDPVLTSVWNSRIPHSLNDGSLWAGRGWSVGVIAGVRVKTPRIVLTVAPQFTRAENRPFPILPSPMTDRSKFASPWFWGVMSADLPLRFGTIPYRRIDAGESSAELRIGPVLTGVTNASQWWGPSIQNALLMSNNTAGIPQLFVRTASPVSTRLGLLEGHFLIGALTESPFFDFDASNNLRSLSAAVITLRPSVDTGLTLGFERAVYAVAGRARVATLLPHMLDVFTRWERKSLNDSSAANDHLTGFFARWGFPTAGLAAHAEWVTILVPSSTRDVLVEPQKTIGYTVGLEWARAVGSGATFRLQMEGTQLEQTPPRTAEPYWSFYTSPSVRAGYTQQGQVIGAAIGPGSSSQFIGGTYLRGSKQLALSLGRVRWNDDAYYLQPSGFTYHTHDISLWIDVSAKYDTRFALVEAGLTRTYRMNHLFQTQDLFGVGTEFDVWNSTFNLRLTPHVRTAPR